MEDTYLAQITLDLPDEILRYLADIQDFYKNELEPGERVPTLEELIIDAVGETYLPNWRGLAECTPRE